MASCSEAITVLTAAIAKCVVKDGRTTTLVD